MYVCMYVRMYVCMYVSPSVGRSVCLHVRVYIELDYIRLTPLSCIFAKKWLVLVKAGQHRVQTLHLINGF